MDPKLSKKEEKQLKKQEWKDTLSREQKSGRIKKIIYWAIGVVVVGLVVWGLIAANSTSTTNSQAIKMPPITSQDVTNGVKNPKVTLVEYADFQCPGCAAYYPVVKQLQKDFPQMLYVYRYFPLSQIHQNAINSAAAAYSADKQGKFFEMADLLFTNQKNWEGLSDPSSVFYTYAKDLNLNLDEFKSDYQSSTTRSFVTDSANKAAALGLPGTPSFFVNGVYISSLPQTYQDFKKIIQHNMNKN